MNPKIAEVTQRIIERSKETRKAYLEKLRVHDVKDHTVVCCHAVTLLTALQHVEQAKNQIFVQ